MKKIYEYPDMEIVRLNMQDVITASVPVLKPVSPETIEGSDSWGW